MPDKITLDVAEAMKELSVEIELIGMRRLSFRIWCAMQIIKFAGWVAGCNIKVAI
jgi:hypothetical protein